MNHFFYKFNNFFSNFEALGSLFLRLGVGIAFIIYGYGKFPLPPEGLTEYFDLPPFLASLVAISELSTGIVLIVAHFINNALAVFLTYLYPSGNIELEKIGYSINNSEPINYNAVIFSTFAVSILMYLLNKSQNYTKSKI